MRLSVNENLISNTVGQGLAPAVEINGYIIINGYYKIKFILYRRDRASPCPQQISYKIKFTDSRKGCPYGLCEYFNTISDKNAINQRQSNGGSKPPTTSSFATDFIQSSISIVYTFALKVTLLSHLVNLE